MMTLQYTLQSPDHNEVEFKSLVKEHPFTLLIFVRHLG